MKYILTSDDLSPDVVSKIMREIGTGRFVACNLFGEVIYQIGSAFRRWSPETGETFEMSQDFASDEMFTMSPLVEAFGEVPEESFLVPLILFVLGGEYSPDNLKLYPIDDAIEVYQGLREAIKDVPNGTKIRLLTSSPT